MSSLERGGPSGWIGLEGHGRSGKTGLHLRGVSVGGAGSTAYYRSEVLVFDSDRLELASILYFLFRFRLPA